MFTIGEFSRITGLSIKALRIYHQRGILEPRSVDGDSGYRYYGNDNVERARIVKRLKELDFGLNDIQEMLAEAGDDADIVDFLEEHRLAMVQRLDRQRSIIRCLDTILQTEKEARRTMARKDFNVEEKKLDAILAAGIRYTGAYSDCGKAFGKIGKAKGRHICGKPFNLYYDADYREHDADIESCMPVRAGKDADGVVVRALPGGRCVSLLHKGPYDTIGRSYQKIMAYVKDKKYAPQTPSREVYHKGPGMIFKGNPETYLTEIQILIE